MEDATKNRRGRPKSEDGIIAEKIAYIGRQSNRSGINQLYAVRAINDIIKAHYPDDLKYFLNEDQRILRQGVAEQLGRVAKEDPEQATKYAAECIELIKQGGKSKDIEKAIRICRKENKR